MSDSLILGLASTLGPIITVIITAMITARANRKHKSEIKETVSEYHKEVNGKMVQLLETTKALGTAEGKAAAAVAAPIELKIGKLEVELKPPVNLQEGKTEGNV